MTTRDIRRGRALALFAAFVAIDASVVMVACSSSSVDDVSTPDATSEGSTIGEDAGRDTSVTPFMEAGRDGGGNCSPANDKCDIVLQNCPAQQECVVGATNKTICQPVSASEQLPRGRACCSNGQTNPCLPGLQCVGGDSCIDGGPQTGRCAPACCEGDDQACGKSDPEGISGQCTLRLVDQDGNELHRVCTYSQACQPYQVQPCTTGQTCIVEDKSGTASCVDLFGAGKPDRTPCSAANDCNDGLLCLGPGDAGVCHYACLLPNTTSPFDAGVEEGGAGRGGCPSNEKCNLQITGLPDWYGACSLDGG
jgi:hypothetical protein